MYGCWEQGLGQEDAPGLGGGHHHGGVQVTRGLEIAGTIHAHKNHLTYQLGFVAPPVPSRQAYHFAVWFAPTNWL